ncbi:MAG: molybdopterin-dependent oxidoreductase [Planctomycetes bacterium]|nr:molybdopterin-dependent oxidoreductase [Planctomycetota bacterium]
MPGLGASFGRGGATTAQQDLRDADCIVIVGSSMAEAHPVAFRFVVAARERGAKVIHIDPRFSRTSALSDLWVPVRAGSDIALFGGLIRHVLETGRFFREYVVHYTNASCILKEDYQGPDALDGFFSGWQPDEGRYDPSSWRYEGDDLGRPRRDLSLEHPRCVLQVLRRHYARYTPEEVAEVTGVSPELFGQVADALTDGSGPERTTALCYSVGWTQHTKGVQLIRSASVLQLLLGNIGRPGGGILALRGHASIQGSTDVPTMYDILPGYMPMPRARTEGDSLEEHVGRHRKRTGHWANLGAYMTSLLRAWYRAGPEVGWGFDLLPRVTRDHSHFSYFVEMAEGAVEGLFVLGQNPAVGGQNARLERRALGRLRWLVVRDLVESETAAFWYGSPEVARGELRPEEIGTEVFLLPAAGHAEKSGTFTNTQRLLQWRRTAVEPPGDCRSEAWFIHQLALRLQARAARSDDPRDAALRALDWWYPEDEHGEPEVEAVLAEINGWFVDPAARPDGVSHGAGRDGRPHHGGQVSSYQELQADGSTACGCWIYSGVLGPDGVNRADRREPAGRYGHGWGFAWPSDRRILYNRASARPDGRPWSERKRLVWWDDDAGRWTGDDVPDFPGDKRPDHVPGHDAEGLEALRGDAPFMLHDDGLGWLFAPSGLDDGPLPTHYEPVESPVRNRLYPRETNPGLYWFPRPDNQVAPPEDPRYPHVLTTYRLTEHHTAGGMSRFLGHLSELQPELFCELSPELAGEVGVTTGDWVVLATPRGGVECKALVTRRMRPLHLDGQVVHQVALPFHWGFAGPVRGDVANDLVPLLGDPNVTIHEAKALRCAVLAGRLREGVSMAEALDALRPGLGAPPARPHPDRPARESEAREQHPGGQSEEGQVE